MSIGIENCTNSPSVLENSLSWHPHLGDIGGKNLDEIFANYASFPPRVTIILASGERTGSEWLCEIMGRTAVLGRPSEYLNTYWMRRFVPDYPEEPERQIEIAMRLGTTANGCFGLKLHPWHFDRLSPAIDLSRFPNPRFVLLRRKDVLGQAISLVRARQTEKFHSFTTEARQPEYDAAQIDKVLDEVITSKARWTKFFARNGIQPLTLSYENFSLDPMNALNKIARFANLTIPGDMACIQGRLIVQRDPLSHEWRESYLAERRSLAYLDQLS